MSQWRAYRVPDPYGCGHCGAPERGHAWFGWCTSPDHRWSKPPEWMILRRMIFRQIYPEARWLPNDYRTGYRKWKT